MSITNKFTTSGPSVDGQISSPEIDSRFRLIIVAGLRTKQLLHGSQPRIETDPLRRRHTTIALEEVRRGLVPFTKKLLHVTDPGYERPLTGKSQEGIADTLRKEALIVR